MRPANLRQALAAIAVLAALSACATVVERIAPEEPRELSGAWNDTDSRLASEDMARGLLGWADNYALKHMRPPTLVVGQVRDLTRERISVATFVGDMGRALVESRRVTFVASGEERHGARDERKDQDHNATEETRKPMGRELGADYLLSGTISAIVDRSVMAEVRYYQVDLALIDLADNSKAWVGQKKIKKMVRRPASWDTELTGDIEREPQHFASHGSRDETGRAFRIQRWECTRPGAFPSCN